VIQTTTAPPTTFARRATVAVGTDAVFQGTASATCPAGPSGDPVCVPPFTNLPPCFLYGTTQALNSNPGFARVWAGTYQSMMGGAGGELNGANSTLTRWAFAIGGTAVHEAGHIYGLTHPNGETVRAGEDPLGTHIMPRGCALTNEQRAGSRRHFDDTSFSILASNVGLSLETIHNWDYANPNAVAAARLQMTVLSPLTTLTVSWTYLGDLSPWDTPTVTASGTATFQGTTYNQFLIVWSTPKPWANGSAGSVGPGVTFHVGTTFAGVDLTQPNPIIVTAVTLQDGSGTPLTLQPRLVGYDAGALDGSDGNFNVRFLNPDPARPLILGNLTVSELPRVVSIDSMVPGAQLKSWQGIPVVPWKTERKLVPPGHENDKEVRAEVSIKDMHTVTLAKLSQAATSSSTSSRRTADVLCTPGQTFDLFPATTMLVTATVIDPAAKHWDPGQGKFVTGPLESKLFYQLRGFHPDLNHNGVDDYIDLYKGVSKDVNHDGVPDEVQQGGGPSPPPVCKPWWFWLIIIAIVVLVSWWLLRRRRH
jgi:hypothetical protein